METVYWLNKQTIDELISSADKNKQSYLSGNFDDFFKDKKNHLRDVGVQIDLEKLDGLSGESRDEVSDSCKIFSAISGMYPSLAARGNIWVYLSHTHLLKYGRKRWIESRRSTQTAEDAIKTHFFGLSPGRLRDDHTAARPWWNAQIASKIVGSEDTDEIQKVLDVFARTADTRSASIERSSVFGDIHLVRMLLQKIEETPDLKKEEPYRKFMMDINFASNGVKFSEMTYETFAEKFG